MTTSNPAATPQPSDTSAQAIAYSAPALSASASLLQRPIAADYLAALTAQLSAPIDQTQAANTVSLLIFRLSAEWFALPARYCQQILTPLKHHRIPHRSNATLQGIVNIRGQMQLKVCLKAILSPLHRDQIPASSPQAAHLSERTQVQQIYPRMVVIGQTNNSGVTDSWVFDVDELDGIHRLQSNIIKRPPINNGAASGLKSAACAQSLFQWKSTPVTLLNVDRLFDQLKEKSL